MKVYFPALACLKCLATCPRCSHLPMWRRRRQAKLALKLIKATFPEVFPEPEPDDRK